MISRDLDINHESAFDLEKIRNDFPILRRELSGLPLVYLDNAATSQKPVQVIDAITDYYKNYNANIHRGVHRLSQEATSAFEEAREAVREYIGARNSNEIIFTSGTTAGINLVANTWAIKNLKKGEDIVISAMEHHGNIVPWQMACERTGANLKVIPMDQNGELLMEEAGKIITDNCRLLAITHVSNSLGTINPVNQLIKIGRSHGAHVLIDGAQAIPHFEVNVQDLDCDFYVFSAHKMLGTTGTGILFGKEEVLSEMPPWQGGGDMIKEVTFARTTYNELPFKFEAGTPNIEGGIALKAAINYLKSHDRVSLESWENRLLVYAQDALTSITGLRIIGQAKQKVPVVSFIMEGLHPYDVGFILDKKGIALRTGHHCTQPVMDFFGIPGTLRASFAFYNSLEEIDNLVKALWESKRMLS